MPQLRPAVKSKMRNFSRVDLIGLGGAKGFVPKVLDVLGIDRADEYPGIGKAGSHGLVIPGFQPGHTFRLRSAKARPGNGCARRLSPARPDRGDLISAADARRPRSGQFQKSDKLRPGGLTAKNTLKWTPKLTSLAKWQNKTAKLSTFFCHIALIQRKKEWYNVSGGVYITPAAGLRQKEVT